MTRVPHLAHVLDDSPREVLKLRAALLPLALAHVGVRREGALRGSHLLLLHARARWLPGSPVALGNLRLLHTSRADEARSRPVVLVMARSGVCCGKPLSRRWAAHPPSLGCDAGAGVALACSRTFVGFLAPKREGLVL